jgi:hypothetical protein
VACSLSNLTVPSPTLGGPDVVYLEGSVPVRITARF